MNEHALDVLEFPALLHLVAGYARSEPGRVAVQSLRPVTQAKAVGAKRGLYADVLGLLAMAAESPALAFEDLSGIMRRAAPEGAVLGGDDLVQVRVLLSHVSTVQDFLRSEPCRNREHIRKLGSALEACTELMARLSGALGKEGELLDAASERLRQLRRQARTLQDRINTALEGMLRSTKFGNVLQERFITVRNGRFVVPVRREDKSAVPGVIHDHSNSGQTVFVEPASTLPLGNELAGVRLEERDECRRILAALTDGVRGRAGEIGRNQWVLTEFDAAFAVGRWALTFDCVLPRFGDQLALYQARHPLLLSQFRTVGKQRDVVPLDLEIPRGGRVMVITGSNSGGKTVALKTVGLLALVAQSGLPVPAAPQSVFVLFDQVFADIGDEQSLEANLSTFSAHMRHLTTVLRNLEGKRRTLVLLDELGAGTDPLEGGALACAVLKRLAACNSLTVATTHLGVVKTFVQEHKGMLNAAVRFNVDSLEPEYALGVGRP